MVRRLLGTIEGSGIIFHEDGMRLGPAEFSIAVDRDAGGRITAGGSVNG